MRVQSLSQEDPLEEGMAIHSSILAWRIPWIEEIGGLLSMELRRVGHNCHDIAQHTRVSGCTYDSFHSNEFVDIDIFPTSHHAQGLGVIFSLPFSLSLLLNNQHLWGLFKHHRSAGEKCSGFSP